MAPDEGENLRAGERKGALQITFTGAGAAGRRPKILTSLFFS
jgi:hypothetical protein